MDIKTVIVDGTFIVQAIKKGIDFIEEFERRGLRVVALRESLQNIKDMPLNSKSSRAEKAIARQALTLFEDPRVDIKTIGKRRINDWLIEKGKEGFFIATRESEVLNLIPRKAFIDAENSIKILDNWEEINDEA